MNGRLAIACLAGFLLWLIALPAPGWPRPATRIEQGCGGRTLYARGARESDTGPVYSPDRSKSVKATRVEDPKDPDGQYINISVRAGSRRFTIRLDGFLSEILWAPDSTAFAVNETEGGGGFDQRTYVFRFGRTGLKKIDVSTPVEKAFGQPVKCDLAIVPNTAVVAWLSSNRVLVAAEVVDVSVCEHMGTFLTYEVSLPELTILARHTQAESKRRFGRFLGCELQQADDKSAARWQNRKLK